MAHGKVQSHTVLHAISVLPEITTHHVLSQIGKNYYGNLEYVKIIFGEKTKHLSGFQS